jgi:hypothetical protein
VIAAFIWFAPLTFLIEKASLIGTAAGIGARLHDLGYVTWLQLRNYMVDSRFRREVEMIQCATYLTSPDEMSTLEKKSMNASKISLVRRDAASGRLRG